LTPSKAINPEVILFQSYAILDAGMLAKGRFHIEAERIDVS